MRWFWIDRFVEFVPGSHAKAVKNVTLAEEHLHDHFPGFPVMPGSLMLEGMAQTGHAVRDDQSPVETGEGVPALFYSGQLLLAANSHDPRYGTVGTPRKLWSAWKEREDPADFAVGCWAGMPCWPGHGRHPVELPPDLPDFSGWRLWWHQPAYR